MTRVCPAAWIRSHTVLFVLALSVGTAGCSQRPGVAGQDDAGGVDAAPAPPCDGASRCDDAGPPGDGGPIADAGLDAPPLDAATDASAADGAVDAATFDAATLDAPPSDAATFDAPPSDAATFDAPPPDTSMGDSGLCPSLVSPVAMPGDDIGGDTWDTFAAGFFASYCTRCHSSTLTTSIERMGAPTGLDWDDPTIVRAQILRIRYDVGVSHYMPLTAPNPTCMERYRLLRWIDVGAP